MVRREGGAGDEGAAVSWYGELVGGCAWTMAWAIAIVVHEGGAGLGPAVSSLISVNHLSGVIVQEVRSGWATRIRLLLTSLCAYINKKG